MRNLLGLVICFGLIACDVNRRVYPLSPTPVAVATTPDVAVTPIIAPTTSPVSCFDSLGLTRRDIRYSVVDRHLYVYVPAANAEYVNVWTPGINETLLGTGPINAEFSVLLPSYGTFKIRLAIERRDSAGICQYDGHSFEVTAIEPPPLPVPIPPDIPPTNPPDEDNPDDPDNPDDGDDGDDDSDDEEQGCLCHVDRSYRNGRWTIKESTKCHGQREGHFFHFSRPYPDYLGVCNGRYED